MRIWDIPVSVLCRQHLLGEHRELHAVWAILTGQAKRPGYENHPETLRWTDRLYALELRHSEQVEEMGIRGWSGHKTPLTLPSPTYLTGVLPARRYAVNTLAEQIANLKGKNCECKLSSIDF